MKSRGVFCLSLLLLSSMIVATRSDFVREPMIVGFDGTIAYIYRQLGKNWKVGGKTVDLMKFMSLNGSSWIRVGVTTNATGNTSLDMALKTIRWAREAALMVDINFYLSSVAADLGKQPAPVEWRGKSVEERAALARDHLKSSVLTLLHENASDHLYEVGNEIDYGVCGSFASDPTKWPERQANIEFLKSTVWKEERIILREAVAGIREADPDAKIVLHLAHWWSLTFCSEFYGFMSSGGVPFDYVGLSYYPSSGIYDLGEFTEKGRADADKSAQEFNRSVTGLIDGGYRILISEFAYPCTPNIKGIFSHFDKQLSGYPFDASGQKKFVVDMLTWLHSKPEVVGVFYFAPSFYEISIIDVWGAFAFFDENGEARPSAFAVAEFMQTASELVAQRNAREALMRAWDATREAQSEMRTEGLEGAKQKAQAAWGSYLGGMFGRANQLANEAADEASRATNPFIRSAFIIAAVMVGVLALLGITALVLIVVPRLRKQPS